MLVWSFENTPFWSVVSQLLNAEQIQSSIARLLNQVNIAIIAAGGYEACIIIFLNN